MNKPDKQMDIYSGVRWSVVAQYGTQVIQFVTTIIVARIVAPESYGLMAMAVVITGFVDVIRTLGFGPAIVQRKQLSEELLSSLFFFILAFSCLLAAGVAATAPLFSWIYDDTRVGLIIAMLSITFIISGTRRIQSSLLARQMAFGRLAIVDGVVAILTAVVAITLAIFDWEVWALVWSMIAGSVARAILLWSFCQWRPRMIFRWSEVRSVLNFGMNLTGYHVFSFSTRNTDKFIIGAFLGATPLGFYSVAYRFLRLPVDAASQILGRVLLPAFSRMQDDDPRLKSAYLRSCGAIAFLTFPLMLGLLVVTRPFIEVVLGEKWLPAIPLLSVLAPLGMIQSIEVTIPYVFLAKGRADWLFRWSVASGILSILGILAGLPWGVVGVAVSYVLTMTALMVLGCWIAFKLIDGLRIRDLFKTLWPNLTCAGTMALLVLGCRTAMEYAQLRSVIVLPVCVAVGILSYGFIVLCFRPPALNEFRRILPERYQSFLPQIIQRRAG